MTTFWKDLITAILFVLFSIAMPEVIQSQNAMSIVYAPRFGNSTIIQPSTAAVSDDGQKVWIAAYNEGIGLLEGQQIRHFTFDSKNKKLSSGKQITVYEQYKLKDGLVAFHGAANRFSIVSAERGLISTMECQIKAYSAKRRSMLISELKEPTIFYWYDGINKQKLDKFPNLLAETYGFYDTGADSLLWLKYNSPGNYTSFIWNVVTNKAHEAVTFNLPNPKDPSAWYFNNGRLWLCYEHEIFSSTNYGATWQKCYKSANSIRFNKLETNGLGIFIEKINRSRYRFLFVQANGNIEPANFAFRANGEILSVDKDVQGNYWLATSTEIRQIMPQHLVFDPEQDNYPENVWAVALDNNQRAYFMPYSSIDGVGVFEPNSGKDIFTDKQTRPLTGGGNYFLGATTDDDGKAVIPVENQKIITYRYGEKANVYKTEGAVFDTHRDKEKRWYLGLNGLLILRSKTSNANWDDLTQWEYIHIPKDMGQNAIGLTTDDNYIYVTTRRRMLRTPKNSPLKWESFAYHTKNITAIEVDYKGTLWCGGKMGLYYMPKQDTNLICIDKKLRNAFSIGILDDTLLLVGHLQGLTILNLNKFYTSSKNNMLAYRYDWYSSQNSQIKSTLPVSSVAQNSFVFDSQKRLWFVGEPKVMRIDIYDWLKSIQNTPEPNAFIEYIAIGTDPDFPERVYTTYDSLPLIITKNEARNLTFYLNSHQQLGSPPCYYVSQLYRGDKLCRTDTIWNEKLSIGDADWQSGYNYTLKIKAFSLDGRAGKIYNFSLRIEARFWEAIMPYLIAVSSILMVLLIGVAYKSYKQNKIINQTKEERNRLQQAIAVKINTHFLKNVLFHSQSFILNKLVDPGKMKVISFLGNLSSNVSLLFDRANEDRAWHTLADELKMVRSTSVIFNALYENQIKYISLPKDEDIEDDLLLLQVPVQVINTFVDNAFEHGIHSLQHNNQGIVEVLIKSTAQDLIIEVRDNGLGVDFVKKQDRKSNSTLQGIKTLENLRDMFNRTNERPFHFTITNNPNPDAPEQLGTLVIIIIPRNYKFV